MNFLILGNICILYKSEQKIILRDVKFKYCTWSIDYLMLYSIAQFVCILNTYPQQYVCVCVHVGVHAGMRVWLHVCVHVCV